MTVAIGRGVSVYEMMKTIGRAGIVTRTGSAEEITSYLQRLNPEELIEEFHRAIVTLSSRGLLSQDERTQIADYAKDWIASQPMGM